MLVEWQGPEIKAFGIIGPKVSITMYFYETWLLRGHGYLSAYMGPR
jgi:hypothetical protein